jgi:hypothetical protein
MKKILWTICLGGALMLFSCEADTRGGREEGETADPYMDPAHPDHEEWDVDDRAGRETGFGEDVDEGPGYGIDPSRGFDEEGATGTGTDRGLDMDDPAGRGRGVEGTGDNGARPEGYGRRHADTVQRRGVDERGVGTHELRDEQTPTDMYDQP